MLSVPRFLAALPVQGGVGFDVDNLVGLAIVLLIYRNRKSIDLSQVDLMKG